MTEVGGRDNYESQKPNIALMNPKSHIWQSSFSQIQQIVNEVKFHDSTKQKDGIDFSGEQNY